MLKLFFLHSVDFHYIYPEPYLFSASVSKKCVSLHCRTSEPTGVRGWETGYYKKDVEPRLVCGYRI